jgi:hypothetical protein
VAFREAFLSRTAPVKRGLKLGGPPSKAKYSLVTDSGLVPRGKGEKYPGRGVKQYLKPRAYKRSEHFGVTACFLHNEPASCSSVARLSDEWSRSESESEQGVPPQGG